MNVLSNKLWNKKLPSRELTYPLQKVLLSRWFSRLVGYEIVPLEGTDVQPFRITPQNSWSNLKLRSHHANSWKVTKGGEDATLVQLVGSFQILYNLSNNVTHFPRLYRLETSGQVDPFSFRVVPTFATVVYCWKHVSGSTSWPFITSKFQINKKIQNPSKTFKNQFPPTNYYKSHPSFGSTS